MTTEEKGEGQAPEDATQAEDVQQTEALSEEAGEAADQETSPPSEEGKASDADEGEQKQDKPEEFDRPSRAQRRKARQREYIQTIETERDSLLRERELILKAGEGDEPPKLEDFDTDTGYEVAVQLYRQNTKQRTERVKELDAKLEDRDKRVSKARQDAFLEQAAEAKSRYPDFEQVAYTAPISDELAGVVMESDFGAEIAYYLGKNPAKARDISAMSPKEQWKAIGALETRLAQPKPPKRAIPEPQEPVRGGAEGTKRTLANARTLKEYERLWIEEQRRKTA